MTFCNKLVQRHYLGKTGRVAQNLLLVGLEFRCGCLQIQELWASMSTFWFHSSAHLFRAHKLWRNTERQRYLLESNGKSCDSVVVRTALESGENSLVDLVFKIIEDLQQIMIWFTITGGKEGFGGDIFLRSILPEKSFSIGKLQVYTTDHWVAAGTSSLTCSPFLFVSFNPLRKKIIAPRGPRRLLCVVVVTTSAKSKGDGTTPAATSPLMWAMSASRIALCLSATCSE